MFFICLMTGYTSGNNVQWLFLVLRAMFDDWVQHWEESSMAVPSAWSNVQWVGIALGIMFNGYSLCWE